MAQDLAGRKGAQTRRPITQTLTPAHALTLTYLDPKPNPNLSPNPNADQVVVSTQSGLDDAHAAAAMRAQLDEIDAGLAGCAYGAV